MKNYATFLLSTIDYKSFLFQELIVSVTEVQVTLHDMAL